MLTLIGGILAIILVTFVVTLLLSPIETLQSTQFGGLQDLEESAGETARRPADIDVFVVFVSGIGSISGDALLAAERHFLDRLDAALPRARIVRDVFPYAPSGRPLVTGQRFFSWFWRVVGRARERHDARLAAILNIRNLYQVLVSADHRYGPLYSQSIAHVAADRLRAAGYPFGSGLPVILLGSSGGGQISVGAVRYVGEMTQGPVSVVAFGGVMSSDPGISSAERLVSLYGDSDWVYRLGRKVFPGRWPSSLKSSWNEAVAEGRLQEISLGPIAHSGAGGYLDPAEWQDGRSRLDRTVGAVARSVREIVPGPAVAPREQATTEVPR